MNTSLADVALPSDLSERARGIFDMERSPATLEDLVVGWLAQGCPTCPEDLVRGEPTPHRVTTPD